MKVRVKHTVEYEIDVEGETVDELCTNAVNELVHTGTVERVRLQTGEES